MTGTGTPATHATVLANEEATNRRYLAHQDAQDARPTATQGARSTLWTGTGQGTRPILPRGPLIGRVALKSNDDDFLDGGREFYIGARRAELGATPVFSWAAPVACTFYRSTDEHPLYESVAFVRTLVHRGDEVIDFANDAVVPGANGEAFAPRELAIALPPRSVPIPTAVARPDVAPHQAQPPRIQDPTEVMPVRSGDGEGPSPEDAHPERRLAATPATPTRPPQPQLDRRVPLRLRAPGTLIAALEAPRERVLPSVLSTLQPDQYEYVTWPADQPLLLQGHPGSGKTIVAAHRAAYLLHPESAVATEGDAVKRLLIVGPTDEYVAHVLGALRSLGVPLRDVTVITVDRFLADLRGVRMPPLELHGPTEHDYRDVDLPLMGLSAKAAATFEANGTPSVAPSIEALYEWMRKAWATLASDKDWTEFLSHLPEWKRARTERRLHPLLAACGIALRVRNRMTGFDHVIVDEGQDVRPLEWALLDRVNASGNWTIVGDINQRRSDYSFHNWGHLIDQLGLPDRGVTEPKVMGLGYRSTGPIMRFANALVPRESRSTATFREDGPAPVVVRVRAGELAATVAEHVRMLVGQFSSGTTAAIGVDPSGLREALRRLDAHPEGAGAKWWLLDGSRVWVGHPDAARGLEFDAVVVAEPAEFRMNVGRHGPLYTSLTRANRELVVVHSQPLPGGLRAPGH
jgi:hypothetical protein